MPSQVLSEQSLGVQAFAALHRGHAIATRQLNVQLVADHGLTISDFEVLLRLLWAPERRLRRVDLAEQVLLTASGITRLLDGLETRGLVARESCATDRRVVYAALTDSGVAKVEEAIKTHFAQIEELFAKRFRDNELIAVTGLLGRLGEATPRAEPERAA